MAYVGQSFASKMEIQNNKFIKGTSDIAYYQKPERQPLLTAVDLLLQDYFLLATICVHSNHMTSSMWVGTLIYHTTMCRNVIFNVLYNPGQVTV